jgi:hypothetical protein
MKNLYPFLVLLFAVSAVAAPGDTTWVTAHSKTDMVWWNHYKDTASFPDGSKKYHKIIMYYTMGCATGGCSDWDYTTRVSLLKPTGVMDSNVAKIDTLSTSPLVIDTTWNVFEVKEPFELARVITPYGNSLNNNWTHDFVYDVTDYYPLLKNDVELSIHYQGWSRGFSATLKFAFIEGTPAREVVKIENLYEGRGDYLNSSDFERDHLPSRTVAINPSTQGLLLKANFSGHGFINSLNCAEFCVKDYYVNVNGNRVATQSIWRDDCGLNPIWPQAGTWLYDRANWCPGDKSLARTHDLTSLISGGSLDIDVDIEPYTYTVPPGEVPANYNYSVQLIQYKSPAHQNDVELERIISPSNEDEFGRVNPVCNGAIVKIRNKGATPLTSCEINYGMDGGTWKTYTWSGNLGFMESEIVELPFIGAGDWMSYKSKKLFIAVADKPNGQPDENGLNNWYDTEIVPANVYPSDIKITLRTNNAASETHWKLTRLDDNTVMASGDNLNNGATYIENLSLPAGCYLLHLEDRGKDGLAYQFNNDGSGSFRIQNDGGAFFIKTFNSNFGTEIKEYFTVGYGIGLKTPALKSFVDVYPNPGNGMVNLDIAYPGKADVNIEVIAIDGKKVYSTEATLQNELKTKLDVSHLPKGVYNLKLQVGTDTQIKKLVIQ